MDFMSVLRGLLGMVTLVGLLFLLSSNRKSIPWKLVGAGILMQVLFAFGVLKVPFVATVFEVVSSFFVVVLEFTKRGSEFVFGSLINIQSSGFIFAFQILPTIIFFSALTSLMFYLGILQKIVYGLSWSLGRVLKISGAENLSTTANIFLGQTEAPLMIKPYLENMNRSEILCVMIGGMANTAGGVLAAYVGFLGGADPVQQLFFAKHLLAASVMSAPATIVISKMLLPQEEKINEELNIPKEKLGSNMIEAISNGTEEGIKLAFNVGAMLIVFIAMIAMVNYILGDAIGSWTGLNEIIKNATDGKYPIFSLQFILGYICAPFVWLLGVAREDMVAIGQLLGEKTILNEFVAYTTLGKMKADQVLKDPKSIIMATYILSGFANFASIGIQVGGIGALAPGKRSMLSELGFKALIGGTIASLMTATIVGMLS
jgi:CNT family concentrative nucleoside transporter